MRPRQRDLLTVLAILLLSNGVLAQGHVSPLTLDWSIAEALRRNERPAVAALRADIASARVDHARAAFLGDLTAAGAFLYRDREVEVPLGDGRSSTLQRHWALRGTLSFSIGVLRPSALPLYRQASFEREAATLNVAEVRRVIAFDVARAFLGVLGAEQLADAAQQRLALADQTAQYSREKVAAGLAGANDITQSELERTAAGRDLARAAAEVGRARLSMGYLVGVPIEAPLAYSAESIRIPLEDNLKMPGQLAASSHRRRADIGVLRAEKSALEAGVYEASVRWVPSVDLVSQYQVGNEIGLTGQRSSAYVGLQLAWAIWDGGRWLAERRTQQALASVTQHDVDALVRRVDLQLALARRDLEQANSDVRSSQEVLAFARKSAAEVTELYRQGLTTVLSFTQATAALYASEADLIRARYALLMAILDLRFSVGLEPLGPDHR